MKKQLSFLLLTGIVFYCSNTLKAQWTSDPNLNTPASIGNDANNPKIASDGHGGAFVLWSQGSFSNTNIYMQYFDSTGTAQWVNNGIAICTSANIQSNPTVTSDGNGGAIVVWDDNRTSGYDIYAQRVNSAGVIQWTSNGLPVCTAGGDQTVPLILMDNTGGAYVTWRNDDRSTNGSAGVFIQHIDNAGTQLWTLDGIVTSTANGYGYNPSFLSDNNGGVIITWNHNDADIFAQRYNAAGIEQWTANGVLIRSFASVGGDAYQPKIVNDNNGGAIIAWIDGRVPNKIYAQRLDAAGLAQWTADGVVVCDTANNKGRLNIASDANNGAYIAWEDMRVDGTTEDIYAQHIDGNGTALWNSFGLAVSTGGYYQTQPSLLSSDNGNVIIAWTSSDGFSIAALYAKKLNTAGVSQWVGDSVAVSFNAINSEMDSDGNNGAILAFRQNFGTGIYVQNICHAGLLGSSGNPVVSIGQVPNGPVADVQTFGGTASASSDNGDPGDVAFDGDTTQFSCWVSDPFQTLPQWIEYDFGAGNNKIVDEYQLFCTLPFGTGGITTDQLPNSWYFLGFNGTTYDTLDTQLNQSLAYDTWFSFRTTNTTAYQAYRILITAVNAGDITLMAEVRFKQHLPNICSDRIFKASSNIDPVYASYDWLLNGVSLGVNNDTLILASTNNNDLVSCVLTTSGCVSTTNVDTSLQVSTVNITTTTVGQTITSNNQGNYQWINCATNTPIVGETNQSFTATTGGDYAVIVDDGFCSDTSACVTISFVGVKDALEEVNNGVKVIPNPNDGSFTLNIPHASTVNIYNSLGELVYNNENAIEVLNVNLKEIASGVYTIKMVNNGRVICTKFVKQ